MAGLLVSKSGAIGEKPRRSWGIFRGLDEAEKGWARDIGGGRETRLQTFSGGNAETTRRHALAAQVSECPNPIENGASVCQFDDAAHIHDRGTIADLADNPDGVRDEERGLS